jgi:Kef-type K+ transport system membrane component KefB
MNAATALLLQLLLVLGLPVLFLNITRLSGIVPLCVMQILIGIVLGPSMLGSIVPAVTSTLFSSESLISLSGIASVGVLFFAFITGLHLDLRALAPRGHSRWLFISAVSLVTPLALGFAGGWWLWSCFSGQSGGVGGPKIFAFAVAISAAVTALPVLAAIVYDLGLTSSPLGQTAIAIGAISDAVLWVLLGGFLTAVHGQGMGFMHRLMSMLLLVAILALIFSGTRFVLGALARSRQAAGSALALDLLMPACLLCVGAGLLTEVSGLHYVLGAFCAGLAVPSGLRKDLINALQPMTHNVMLPFFFAWTGMHTHIDLSSSVFVAVFLTALAISFIGKFLASTLAARVTGERWRFSLGLGALLQTKGLMEVVVLNMLLDAHILSTNTFSALIAMAVVTTALTAPMVRLASIGLPLLRVGRRGRHLEQP